MSFSSPESLSSSSSEEALESDSESESTGFSDLERSLDRFRFRAFLFGGSGDELLRAEEEEEASDEDDMVETDEQ